MFEARGLLANTQSEFEREQEAVLGDNLFIWPSDKESLHGGIYNQNGYHVLGWTQSGMNYLAVSELGEKELRDFVEKIQAQIVDSRPGE